jgi:hypothetical protein
MMQLNKRTNNDSMWNRRFGKQRRQLRRRISSATVLVVTSTIVILLVALALAPSNIKAFVSSPSRHSSHSYQCSSHQQSTTTTTRLFYTMPDVSSMKAAEMRQELESYGISTHTLFDKHEFEEKLMEARRHYEQTLDDVMASTRPKEKKKPSQQQQPQAKRKTVSYQNGRHQDERIYSSDAAQHQQHHGYETAGGGGGQHTQTQERPRQRPRQQQQQQRPRQQRQHYRASPDPVGPNDNFHQYNNANAGRQQRERRSSSPFEQDPLFAHEAQHAYQDQGGRDFYGGGGGGGGHHHEQQQHQQHYDEYEVGGGHQSYRQQQRYRHEEQIPRTYEDPDIEMKYQDALQEAYNMKVEDLQLELNERGISTKYCMIFKDFCNEYAKAIADDKQKVVIKVTRLSDDDDDDDTDDVDHDDDDDDDDDDDEDTSSSIFGDDDDYDPHYRDVVMQKYDPSMWI